MLYNRNETIKVPFKARILELGFIKAESAVIGRLKGCMGKFMSMMTTLFCGAVSLMQMYLSDSIVTCVKFMNCVLIPMLGNCNKNNNRKKKKNESIRSKNYGRSKGSQIEE